MSDLSGIALFAALGFLLVVFLSFIGNLVDRFKNRHKQPKTSDSKPIVSSNSETTKDPEHDITYGEDSFEQEDDELHEEVY